MTEYKADFDGAVENFDDLADKLPSLPAHIYGADEQADNMARAGYGAVALLAYVKRVGGDEFEVAIGDLLGDLRHLCDGLGIDFEDASYSGERHYDAEIRGEL